MIKSPIDAPLAVLDARRSLPPMQLQAPGRKPPEVTVQKLGVLRAANHAEDIDEVTVRG